MNQALFFQFITLSFPRAERGEIRGDVMVVIHAAWFNSL